MQLTIVKEDNLVLVDRQAQMFDLSCYSLPETLWALQWKETSGEIEYTDKNNEKIIALPDWTTPIIANHKLLAEEQQLQQEKENQQAIFLQNGQARIERIKRQQATQKAKEQKTINDYVRSIM